MAWEFVSEWHEPLRQAPVSRKGSVLTNREWDDLISEVPGIGSKAQYIHPSDHCVNMKNKGACNCAEARTANQERVALLPSPYTIPQTV